jgi:outer membrane receptor protein involved in Fe transport
MAVASAASGKVPYQKKYGFLADEYKNYVKKRAKGFPLAYILGKKNFYNLDFKVTKNTLVPRPETELLVDEAIELGLKIKKEKVNFIDVGTGDQLGGNPFLVSSTADNYDLRIEFYPGQFEFSLPFGDTLFHVDDMLGMSLFYKEIVNPIEFLRPTDGNLDEIPFNNPEGAVAEGVEFEFSKNLGFLSLPYAEYFTFGGNISFTSAVAGVSDGEKALLGLNSNTDLNRLDDERQLTEQPEQILNLNLTYDHPDWGTRVTLAYNEKSEILESIGSEQDFDAFRGPTERLDLIISHAFDNGLTLNFAVKNLLDAGYETYFRNRAPDLNAPNIGNLQDPSSFAQDNRRKTVDTVGRSFSFSVGYEF